MNLSEGIEKYVAHKKNEGLVFRTGQQSFREFLERVGDIQMRALSTLDLARYLAYFDKFPGAWQIRFCLLERFLDYWIVRGEISPLPMPPRKAKSLTRFLPYVFTRSELRTILASAPSSQSRWNCAIDYRTLQTLVIVAYATGASPGEVRALKHKDLQLRKRILQLCNPRLRETRTIPVGSELCDILTSFSQWRFGAKKADDHLFVTKEGKSLSATHVSHAFARLCQSAGVRRRDGFTDNPRFQDLRNTFAVHRVAAWVEAGSDLNRLLPALAGYMGMADLVSSESYLKMTPERFCGTLTLLSPKKRRVHWKDDPAVMTFLAKL
ncbi:MAG TPA: tyrosine-type recombinase/integrase [Acidobacteriaceae bacterium]